MPLVQNAQYTNDITYTLDFFIEESEYTPWKNRLTDQLLKTVEVQGFRKGKVPRDIALTKVNPSLLTETIIKETLERYAQNAVEEVTKKLQEDSRIIQNIEISIDPQVTGERDNGFGFQLVAKLLPNLDLSILDTIKLPELNAADIPNRPDEKEFIATEHARFLKTYNEYTPTEKPAKKGDKVICDLNGSIDGVKDSKLTSPNVEVILGAGDFLPEIEKGLVGISKDESKTIAVTFPDTYFEKTVAGKHATFIVTCKDVVAPQHKDLKAVFENNPLVADQFKSLADFDEFLVKFYEDETDRLLEELRQRTIIEQVVSAIPDISLPEDRIESETKRIFAAVKNDAETKNVSLFEAFSRSGIPADGAKPSSDEIEIRALIELYVRNEFKLSTILHFIYESRVTPKISTQQLEQATSEVKKNPTQFGLNSTSDDDTVRRHTLDRLQRQEGARYLFNFFNARNLINDTPKKTGTKKSSTSKPSASATTASDKKTVTDIQSKQKKAKK